MKPIDELVLGLITKYGSAVPGVQLVELRDMLDHVDERVIDRALQRLRKQGKVKFMGKIAGWMRVEDVMTSKGADMIAEERARQVAKEGWTPKHDDEHDNGALAIAAACYASPVPLRAQMYVRDPRCNCRAVGECPDVLRWKDPWPWDETHDKRKKHDRIRSLTIAGALIAAEIDRLLRLGEDA